MSKMPIKLSSVSDADSIAQLASITPSKQIAQTNSLINVFVFIPYSSATSYA